ncbi:MurR/RpiR family transcriptional regulator [uncultured Clostridium sp.]|uniref:MurR/RpiR family transcriptional regulator n=1 Tax=uncultured Clostridium sp. TaxID=59620 RepID=UPI00260C6400|nr:MurR/RpiR family transcriptional regulator [uncultured Clostridium sp.]
MGIIDEIKLCEYKQSKNDKILEEYIQENGMECIYKSISEIAHELGIGEATITRFVKKIGFNGFQEFKLTLAKKLAKTKSGSIISSNLEKDEKIEETAKNMLEANKLVLDKTLEGLNLKNIIKIREMILRAKKTVFFGIGNSALAAMDANYKFMRIGLNTNVANDSHTMYMMASLLRRNDLVFLVSHTGETKELLEVAKLAKENRAEVISITSNNTNSLMDLSDVNINYLSVERKFETGSIRSKIGQSFLIELIYEEVIKEIYEEALENKIKTTYSIENTL